MSEAVAITFIVTMISTLIVGVISSSLVTYCIMKRRASEDLAAPNQPQKALCMKKNHSQRRQSKCLKWETILRMVQSDTSLINNYYHICTLIPQ